MSNETIVAKGKQIEAINIELEDTEALIKQLKAKVNTLHLDKNRLTGEIIELKHNDNQLAQEPLINEWIGKMKSKYGNAINFGLGLKNGEEQYTITITFDDDKDEIFYVSKAKSESATKEFLDELEQTIILVNELFAQNVLEELNSDLVYVNKSSNDNKIFTSIYFDESNKTIRLRLRTDGLIDVHISETIYDVPQYQVELHNGVYLKPKATEDEYGNEIKKYAYELSKEQTVYIKLAVSSIKSALKKFDETQAKYVKSVN